jgi:Lrp/AsnC family transcriptional regulator, leucine-responsive regulatory protein
MATRPLDQLDRLIVHEMRLNGRITFAELAGHIGLSESQCIRRLHALEQSGVIQGYLTLIDPIALRLPVSVHVEIRLHGASDADAEAFEKAIEARREIMGCWRTAGDADYMVSGSVPDPPAYERLLNTLAELDHVAILRTHLRLRLVKLSSQLPLTAELNHIHMGTTLAPRTRDAVRCNPSRLIQTTPSRPTDHAVSGEPHEVSSSFVLDDFDRRILRILANNGRISNVELAKRIGLSPAPCLRRVRALEAAGVIQSYLAIVDFDAMGLVVTFIMVRLDCNNREWQQSFEQAVRPVPEIVAVDRTTGGSDYLLRCVTSGLSGVEELLSHPLFSRPGIESIRSAISLRYCIPIDMAKLHETVSPAAVHSGRRAKRH